MAVRVNFTGPPKGKYQGEIQDIEKPIARAATNAFRDAAKIIQAEGRALILSAKLGARFASQFKVFVFPRRQFSLTPTLRGFHARGFIRSRIGHFANVFVHGAEIRPKNKPLLWFALKTAPLRIAGKRPTIKLYLQNVGPLRYIKRPGKDPILAAETLRKIRGTHATVASLKAGDRHAKRRLAGAPRARKTFILPIFIGVPQTRIKDRVDIEAVFARAYAQLPILFDRRLSGID